MEELTSQIYLDALRMETKLSLLILDAKIELGVMEAEIEGYKKINGDTSAYRLAKERLNTLWKAVRYSAIIDDESYMHRVNNERIERENKSLKKYVSELENQLESNRKAWEAI